MSNKIRHVFYLGNNSAVVVTNNLEGKQATFATLNKTQRQAITVRGERYYSEPASSRLSPEIKHII